MRSGLLSWTAVTCRQLRRGSAAILPANRLTGLMAEVLQKKVLGSQEVVVHTVKNEKKKQMVQEKCLTMRHSNIGSHLSRVPLKNA